MRTTSRNHISVSIFNRMNFRIILITIAAIAFIVNLTSAKTVDPNPGLFGEKQESTLILNLDAVEISQYEILINGESYEGEIKPVDYKAVYVYNLSALENTTFFVNEIDIEGTKFSGKFEYVSEFIYALNKISSTKWNWDEERHIMFGGKKGTKYSSLIITREGDQGEMLEFSVGCTQITKSVKIVLPPGDNVVTLNNFVEGTSERKEYNEGIAYNNKYNVDTPPIILHTYIYLPLIASVVKGIFHYIILI